MNDTPYLVGESAERHGLITQRTDVARYTKDYYSELAAISLSKLFGMGREVACFLDAGQVFKRVNFTAGAI